MRRDSLSGIEYVNAENDQTLNYSMNVSVAFLNLHSPAATRGAALAGIRAIGHAANAALALRGCAPGPA